MKYTQLLLFLMGFTFSVISQIKVKTTETGLNLRTEPTTSSDVLHSIPNESELLYANDWSEEWIKVRYISYGYMNGGDEDIDAIGWINASYVEPKFFKSTILQSLSWEEEVDGAYTGIYGVFGLLGITSFDNITEKINLNVKIGGKKLKLEQVNYELSHDIWLGQGLRIEFFGATTDSDVGFSESKGTLRIEYNGKVEYIYAALGGGC